MADINLSAGAPGQLTGLETQPVFRGAQQFLAPYSALTQMIVEAKAGTLLLSMEDSGKMFTFLAAGQINLPRTALKGANIAVAQLGSGQVTFAPLTGATMVNSGTATKTASQYSIASAICLANSDGRSAIWLLSGGVA